MTEKYKSGIYKHQRHSGINWNNIRQPYPEGLGLPHSQTTSGERVSVILKVSLFLVYWVLTSKIIDKTFDCFST